MSSTDALMRAMERRDVLQPQDRALIEALPLRRKQFDSGEDIAREGSRPTESCLVLEGFAARSKYLSSGTRQLTAMHVPCDFVDLHSLLLKVMDHSVVALGSCEVAFVPHDRLRALTEASPHLARLLWLLTVIDSAIQRAWITSLGRRSAEQQLAHLICELFMRLDVVGLVQDRIFDLPVKQMDLSDMLGLSLVHVNRTLQALRATGLIEWHGRTVTIVDFDRLSALAEFDPIYLNLSNERR